MSASAKACGFSLGNEKGGQVPLLSEETGSLLRPPAGGLRRGAAATI